MAAGRGNDDRRRLGGLRSLAAANSWENKTNKGLVKPIIDLMVRRSRILATRAIPRPNVRALARSRLQTHTFSSLS
jgi:hypothetical protein